MSRLPLCVSNWLVLLVVVGFCGCGPAADTASDPGTIGAAADSGDEEADEIEVNILKLPEADQALARAQKICPVSGEPLGSMGAPLKVSDVAGRDVFVCCEGCVEDLKADPEKFLAKLDAAAAEPSEQ
ncbi:MAG: hypothetical protein R3C10_02890 [Pirellulales bacterium]